MKKREWDKKIPMDQAGVQLLGAALLKRAEFRLSLAETNLTDRLKQDDTSEFGDLPHDIEHYEKEVRAWKSERAAIRLKLQALKTPSDVFEKAGDLVPMDFRFRWDLLRDNLILLGYLSDDQPQFAQNWDRTTPIGERWGSAETVALKNIFVSESRRLIERVPEDPPEPRTHEDFLFYLTIWKHCECEQGQGHRRGMRWADGRHSAASYAWSLRRDAEVKGSPISNDEAIRRAIASFELVSPDKFKAQPDKESVIVSYGGDLEARRNSAIKAVRKILAEIDTQQRLLE